MENYITPQQYVSKIEAGSDAWQRLVERAAGRKPKGEPPQTVFEIMQQPWAWYHSVASLRGPFIALTKLASKAPQIYLTGAGSSYYVGRSVDHAIRSRLHKPTVSIPTTDFILDVKNSVQGGDKGLLVSFSRSGESVESFEGIKAARRELPEFEHLLITCNSDGRLIQQFSSDDDFWALALHPATCDRGLAMTSSFTSMVIAAQMLAFPGDWPGYLDHVRRISMAGERILDSAANTMERVAHLKPKRVCLLGSGVSRGAASEGALKILEMTDGRVATLADGYLGIRHGPLSFVDDDTLLVFFVSADPRMRLYEVDLIKEVYQKGLGCLRVGVGYNLDNDLDGLIDEAIQLPSAPGIIPDDFRPPLDVLVAQVLALCLSLDLALDPDHPSPRGVINRVAQGVTIHSDE